MNTFSFSPTTGSFGRRKRPPGKSRLLMWAMLAPVCLLLALASPGHARAGDLSPEFTLLLNDIAKKFPGLYVDAAGVGKSRVCPLLTHYHATNAVSQVVIKRAIMGGVVDPLSNGLKFGASASGVGMAGIFIYDLAYCAYTSESKEAFGRCMANATFGVGENYVGGKAAKYSNSNLIGAAVSTSLGVAREALGAELANRFWGEWDARVEAYQAVTESYTAEYDDGRCVNSIKATWDRHKNQRPGYLGGIVTLEVKPNCDCNKKGGIGPKVGSRGRLEKGEMVVEVPIKYVDIGNRNAGWRPGPIEKVRLMGKCCGLKTEHQMAINGQGQRVPWDDPPPPGPKPPPPPPTGPTGPTGGQGGTATPPAPAWSAANPCPKCQPIANALAAERQNLAAAQAKEAILKNDVAALDAKADGLRRKIATLESRLNEESGIGATLFDADGTRLKSSYDQGDGTVKITTYNPDGSVQSVDYRQRKSTEQVQQELAQARADLADAEARKQKLSNDLGAVQMLIRQLQAMVQKLYQDLVDCVAKHCNTTGAVGGNGTGVGGTSGTGGGPGDDGPAGGGGLPGDGLPGGKGDVREGTYKTELSGFGLGELPKISGATGETAPASGDGDEADPGATDIGDLNSDGIPDVVIANRVSGQVTVFLGDGVGYPEIRIVGALTGADRVSISDLNFDGLPDVVVASPAISEVTTMLNDGAGGFRQQPAILTDTVPWIVSVVDVDADRTPDLRLDDRSGDGGETLPGDGAGGFSRCDCGPEPGDVAPRIDGVTFTGSPGGVAIPSD